MHLCSPNPLTSNSAVKLSSSLGCIELESIPSFRFLNISLYARMYFALNSAWISTCENFLVQQQVHLFIQTIKEFRILQLRCLDKLEWRCMQCTLNKTKWLCMQTLNDYSKNLDSVMLNRTTCIA